VWCTPSTCYTCCVVTNFLCGARCGIRYGPHTWQVVPGALSVAHLPDNRCKQCGAVWCTLWTWLQCGAHTKQVSLCGIYTRHLIQCGALSSLVKQCGAHTRHRIQRGTPLYGSCTGCSVLHTPEIKECLVLLYVYHNVAHILQLWYSVVQCAVLYNFYHCTKGCISEGTHSSRT
jgi:hypothetical protein